MWAVISIKHSPAGKERLNEILKKCFGESFQPLDAINRSIKFNDRSDEDKIYLSRRIIYSTSYHDALVIFQRNSENDFYCHIEANKPIGCRELSLVCDRLFEDVVTRLKVDGIEPALNDIVVRFYEGDLEIGIVGRYQSIRDAVWEMVKGQGVFWGGFTAIIAIGVWIFNKGVSMETLYLSVATCLSLIILLPVFAVLISIFRKQKVVYHVEL